MNSNVEELFDNKPKVSRRLPVLPSNPESKREDKAVGPGRFPSWLHRKLPKGGGLWETSQILTDHRLPTVCEEAKCPNLTDCWSRKTATYLVLGKACTRACGFCDIDTLKTPPLPDPTEPSRVAESVLQLGLRHVVITMVARDDQPDGGAAHLVAIVEEVRRRCPHTTLELLTSDFAGNPDAWNAVLASRPEVFNHNLETVRRLTPRVRHKATYDRTLELLAHAHRFSPRPLVKSGLMVGLGEEAAEVEEAIRDLKKAGCDTITIGQYLQPNPRKLLVKAFVPPTQFDHYAAFGKALGVANMHCGPFVRSSYNADLFIS